MNIYVVIAPKKSGTTSVFKLLTDNNKLPAIHTHSANYITIHDTPDMSFLKNAKAIVHKSNIIFSNRFSFNVKPYRDEFAFVEYEIDMRDHELECDLLWNMVNKTYTINVISILRNPIDRYISDVLHLLDVRYIYENFPKNQETNIIDFVKNLTNEEINNCLDSKHLAPILHIIKNKQQLLDIDDIFGCLSLDISNNCNEIIKKYFASCNQLTFDFEDLKNDAPQLIAFLDLPRERNKYDRKNYVFNENFEKVVYELQKFFNSNLEL